MRNQQRVLLHLKAAYCLLFNLQLHLHLLYDETFTYFLKIFYNHSYQCQWLSSFSIIY